MLRPITGRCVVQRVSEDQSVSTVRVRKLIMVRRYRAGLLSRVVVVGGGIRPVGVAERRGAAGHQRQAPGARPQPWKRRGRGHHRAARHRPGLGLPVRLGPHRGRCGQPDIEHALYAERSLIRMLGMRRTVFVVPMSLVPVIQAPAPTRSPSGTAALAQRVEKSSIAANRANWLKEVGEATVQALAARGSATGGELAQDQPRLRAQIVSRGRRARRPGGHHHQAAHAAAAEGLIVRGRPRGSGA